MEDDLTTSPAVIYFRFPDEATGMAALELAGLLSEDGEFIAASHSHCLDVIGVISMGGEYDEEGNVVTPPTILDGWHVNYQGAVPSGWEPYIVTPEQPVRRWF